MIWYFAAGSDHKPARTLPYFGPKNSDSGYVHRVGPFGFVNQDGDSITNQFFDGHIYVTEFFFTTCQSICPVMNEHLQAIYAEFSAEPELLLLSHTVDPETDKVEVLKQYATEKGVSDDRWQFVTGPKTELYRMAREAYLLDSSPAAHPDEDFVHTQKFALVDADKRIRGYYDGTDSVEIVRLSQDIKILLKEHRYLEKAAD